MPNPEVNVTTSRLHQMTSSELNRATVAVQVLTSALIAPYIADPVLAEKLDRLKTDLNQEASERPA